MTDSASRAARVTAARVTAARVTAAELAADRWVLLEPPSPVSRFWWRALAVTLPVLSLVLLTYSPEGLAARPASQWVVVAPGALMAVAGGIWLWIEAAAPREITTEVNRLLPARPWREYRRLERALRRGGPITGTDRPAAAAYTTSQTHLFQPGQALTMMGFLLTFVGDTATGIEAWLFPVLAATVTVILLAVVYRARTLYAAAERAGVAPVVSDTPQVSPRVG